MLIAKNAAEEPKSAKNEKHPKRLQFEHYEGVSSEPNKCVLTARIPHVWYTVKIAGFSSNV